MSDSTDQFYVTRPNQPLTSFSKSIKNQSAILFQWVNLMNQPRGDFMRADRLQCKLIWTPAYGHLLVSVVSKYRLWRLGLLIIFVWRSRMCSRNWASFESYFMPRWCYLANFHNVENRRTAATSGTIQRRGHGNTKSASGGNSSFNWSKWKETSMSSAALQTHYCFPPLPYGTVHKWRVGVSFPTHMPTILCFMRFYILQTFSIHRRTDLPSLPRQWWVAAFLSVAVVSSAPTFSCFYCRE